MGSEYLSFQSLNLKEFIEFVLRFVFDFIIIFIIAKIYFKARKKKDILFVLFLLNIVVFIVCYLLQSVQLSIGFAFGIFAIFSILRYRTSTIPIKEMTYIFISISTAIINALTILSDGYGIMVFGNLVIIGSIYIFERKFSNTGKSKTIVYDNLTLITPDNLDKLVKDIELRTGLNIIKVEIGKIDFRSNMASLKIFY